MFGLLKEVKKDEETLLHWGEYKPLLEAQENSRKLKDKRVTLEKQLRKAVSIETECYQALDAAAIEHMINKISDKEFSGIETKHKEAKANTLRIKGLLQAHDETCNRLQRGIEIYIHRMPGKRRQRTSLRLTGRLLQTLQRYLRERL